MQFKVGDEVRTIKGIYAGFTGKIIMIRLYNKFPYLVQGDHGFELFADHELIATTTPKCPIVLPKGINATTSSEDLNLFSDFCTNGDDTVSLTPKCECGSHAVNIDKHSDYCPLYIK